MLTIRAKRRFAYGACLTLIAILVMTLFTAAVQAADPNFGNTQFRNLWVTQDRLVGAPGVTHPFTWGPSIPDAPNSFFEPYTESPGGQRQIQYFDKAHMELNNPDRVHTEITGLGRAALMLGKRAARQTWIPNYYFVPRSIDEPYRSTIL